MAARSRVNRSPSGNALIAAELRKPLHNPAKTSCTSTPRAAASSPRAGSSSAAAPSRNSALARNGHADCNSSMRAPPAARSPARSGGIAPSCVATIGGLASNVARASDGEAHSSGATPGWMPPSNALGSSGASSSNAGTLRTTSGALPHNRSSVRRARSAEISAVAPGTPRRDCQARGRNGSGAAGGGHWLASSPQTHIASNLMPARRLRVDDQQRRIDFLGLEQRGVRQFAQQAESMRRTHGTHHVVLRSRIRRAAPASAAAPGARRCRGLHPASRRAAAVRSSGVPRRSAGCGAASRPRHATPLQTGRPLRDNRCAAARVARRSSPRSLPSLRRTRASSAARALAS